MYTFRVASQFSAGEIDWGGLAQFPVLGLVYLGAERGSGPPGLTRVLANYEELGTRRALWKNLGDL